jgi:hypothetical protein
LFAAIAAPNSPLPLQNKLSLLKKASPTSRAAALPAALTAAMAMAVAITEVMHPASSTMLSVMDAAATPRSRSSPAVISLFTAASALPRRIPGTKKQQKMAPRREWRGAYVLQKNLKTNEVFQVFTLICPHCRIWLSQDKISPHPFIYPYRLIHTALRAPSCFPYKTIRNIF